jgi:hypothetical protein
MAGFMSMQTILSSIQTRVHITERDVLNYYESHNIVDFPKRKNGMPNMKYKQNKITQVKLIKMAMLQQNAQQNIHNTLDTTSTTNNNINNQERSHHRVSGQDYRSEILNLTDKEIETLWNQNETYDKSVNTDENVLPPVTDTESKSCPICYEMIETEYCKLKCGHTYCTSCTIYHFRVANSCPLCRVEICDKLKSIDKISTQFSQALVHQELTDMEEYMCFSDEFERYSFTASLCNEIEDFTLIAKKLQNKQISESQFDLYKNEMIKQIFMNVSQMGNAISARVSEFYNTQL